MAPISLRGRAAQAARRASRPVARSLPVVFPLITPLITAALLMGCSYVDRARDGSDLVVGVAEQYKLETLVQADLERQRLRAARCYSPLLTPATLSAAAADSRLGTGWVDGLLQDCPRFSAFLSELLVRRARTAGLITFVPPVAALATTPLLPLPQPAASATGNPGASGNAPASLEAVEP